jgi:fluoride exporter
MSRFLLVCLGGACGTGARYLLGEWMQARFGAEFPWGTLAINATGSFLLSVVMRLAVATEMDETLRLMLAVGVLGGFTTYSSFNYETLKLAHDGAWLAAAANVLATVMVCLAAGIGGLATARALVGR